MTVFEKIMLALIVIFGGCAIAVVALFWFIGMSFL